MSDNRNRKRRRKSAKPRAATFHSQELRVTIDQVGARGDGVALDGERRIYVADTVAGDDVSVRTVARRGDGIAATVLTRHSDGPGRIAPICPLFGRCGGCAAQHLGPDLYAQWKTAMARDALDRRGIDTPLEPMIIIPPGHRRRAAFAVKRLADRLVLGFNARLSDQIVPVDTCPLLRDEINSLLPDLHQLLSATLPSGTTGDVIFNVAQNGVDLVLAVATDFDMNARQAMVEFAEQNDLARLALKHPDLDVPEPVIQRTTPTVTFGKVPIQLPPGTFLQPSIEGEQALTAAVLDGLAGEKSIRRIGEFFAGCGSFTFPLAAAHPKATIQAVEWDAAMTQMLSTAAGRSGLGGRIKTVVTDLHQSPPTAKELSKFDTVIFDPPRAGAKDLAENLAASSVPLVIGVSCNPATFARDARTLINAGFSLEKITPVDQFPFAAHLEVVGVFRR